MTDRRLIRTSLSNSFPAWSKVKAKRHKRSLRQRKKKSFQVCRSAANKQAELKTNSVDDTNIFTSFSLDDLCTGGTQVTSLISKRNMKPLVQHPALSDHTLTRTQMVTIEHNRRGQFFLEKFLQIRVIHLKSASQWECLYFFQHSSEIVYIQAYGSKRRRKPT